MKAIIRGSVSKRQREAIAAAARCQMFRQKKEMNSDFDALVLYVLHARFGFGKARLRAFYDVFISEMKALDAYYEMGSETGYVAKTKLKEIGVDVEAWNDETGTP